MCSGVSGDCGPQHPLHRPPEVDPSHRGRPCHRHSKVCPLGRAGPDPTPVSASHLLRPQGGLPQRPLCRGKSGLSGLVSYLRSSLFASQEGGTYLTFKDQITKFIIAGYMPISARFCQVKLVRLCQFWFCFVRLGQLLFG